jgi:iron complex outermembrane receptor protein
MQKRPSLSLLLISVLLAPAAQAQSNVEAPTDKKPAAPDAKGTTLKRVEVTGTVTDTEKRRQSTAAKIIVGREDIEKFGDSTMGELLKRLPGVTAGGRPGRGGPPRMRGMGGGYTQIMIDGQRVAPGTSLDDLSPDQIERIEVMRAPTAETGARAIAGSINIITRGGYTRRVNDIKLGASFEDGDVQPGISWSRNDTAGDLIYNFSLSAMHGRRSNDSTGSLLTENLSTGEAIHQASTNTSSTLRDGIHANLRLQWRSDGGDSLVFNPMVVTSKGVGSSQSLLSQDVGPAPFERSVSSSENQFSTMRLNGQWTHLLDSGGTLFWSGGTGRSVWSNSALRTNSGQLAEQNSVMDSQSQQQDSSLTSSLKLSQSLANEHSLVAGAEVEANRRTETGATHGATALDETSLNNDLKASSTRLAVYAQDEWNLSPQWAAHAGLRWEGIRTEGSTAQNAADVSNVSRVLTPLLHAVWKPAPNSRDQIRISLTRSYRAPDLQNMVANPSINGRYLGRGANTVVFADSAGNPELRPELASGLDVAFEHYMAGGGMLSANVFYRTIGDLIRRQSSLETVPWADVPRWVARPQNIGDASTQGVELEAKLRLSEVWEDAPRVDIRANASLFRSRVSGIEGPNNRLSEQPDGTLNFGADYRLNSLPWTLGGNFNWTPGYTTQLSETQTSTQGDKIMLEAYGLWTVQPGTQLRISAGNITPRNYVTSGTQLSVNALGQSLRDSSQNIAPTTINVQVRLEMKL